MNFHEELRRLRESLDLSPEQAAERLHLSVLAYQDYEDGTTPANYPLRCGLLVGLGMASEQAALIAARTVGTNVSHAPLAEEIRLERPDRFVRETDESFILIDRTHDGREYTIPKGRVCSAENILGWAEHVSKMPWITRKHLEFFIALASRHLGLTIHPV